MKDLLELMKTRRSVRKYKPDMIPQDVLDRIIIAGTYSATGRNLQSPIIIAVTNKEMRDKISEMNRKIGGWDEGFDPFYGAPVILIVLADKSCPTYIYDGSLVMGNLLNAAASIGVGACWIHRAKETFEREDGKVLLKKWGINGNYIGILMWACLFGLAMKKLGSDTTKNFMANTADAISTIVRWIINLAPFGIMGLVFTNVSDNGLSIFTQYGRLLLLLVGTMLLMALVINPFIIFIYLHRNPYPLVFRCLRESGLTAFFTRSSAANIPVNMAMCEKLGLDKDFYSVSIPLGATINMDGTAIYQCVATIFTR